MVCRLSNPELTVPETLLLTGMCVAEMTLVVADLHIADWMHAYQADSPMKSCNKQRRNIVHTFEVSFHVADITAFGKSSSVCQSIRPHTGLDHGHDVQKKKVYNNFVKHSHTCNMSSRQASYTHTNPPGTTTIAPETCPERRHVRYSNGALSCSSGKAKSVIAFRRLFSLMPVNVCPSLLSRYRKNVGVARTSSFIINLCMRSKAIRVHISVSYKRHAGHWRGKHHSSYISYLAKLHKHDLL